MYPGFARYDTQMIDSHCHLDYCDDPEAAADPSLDAIISIGTSLSRCQKTIKLAERFDNVWAAVGIHPNNASEAQADVRQEIAVLARHPKVVAIGETGFDNYWDKESLELQRSSFAWQAELAADLNKALILHVRDKQNQETASLASAEMMKTLGYSKGILHCFNGHQQLLETGLELGWMVSFAGNLTYKSATDLQDAAKHIPQDRLLIETDSPYLTPQAKRGKRNVPANVRFTAEFLAELRGESLAAVEAYTDANARRIYGL